MLVDDLFPIDLPPSGFLGPYDPRTGGDYRRPHNSAERLWAIVDNRLDDGIEPTVVNVPVGSLMATQDWIGGVGGHGTQWPSLLRYPVVLSYRGQNLILDGHHRVSDSRDHGAESITVYLFQ